MRFVPVVLALTLCGAAHATAQEGPGYHDVLAWRWVAPGADAHLYWDEGQSPVSTSLGDSVYVLACSSEWCRVAAHQPVPFFYVRAGALLTHEEILAPEWAQRVQAQRARADSVLRVERVRADSVLRGSERQAVADSIAFLRRMAGEGAGKWTVSTRRSLMDDSQIIILTLRAENVAVGWLAAHRPSLIVRCQEGATDVYVVTGMSSNPELGSFQEVTVRLRFDAGEASEETWSEATSNDALMSQDAENLAIHLARSRRFRFGFTPFNASPVVVTFDVRGLARHLTRIARACTWPDNWRRRMYEGPAVDRAREARRDSVGQGLFPAKP